MDKQLVRVQDLSKVSDGTWIYKANGAPIGMLKTKGNGYGGDSQPCGRIETGKLPPVLYDEVRFGKLPAYVYMSPAPPVAVTVQVEGKTIGGLIVLEGGRN